MTINNLPIPDLGQYSQDYTNGTLERTKLESLVRRIRTTKDPDQRDELTARLTSQSIGNLNIQGWYITKEGYVCLELTNTAEIHPATIYKLSEREIEARQRNPSPIPDPKPEFEY